MVCLVLWYDLDGPLEFAVAVVNILPIRQSKMNKTITVCLNSQRQLFPSTWLKDSSQVSDSLFVNINCIFKETPNTDDAAAAETQKDNAGTETQTETEKPDSRRTGSGSGKKEQTSPPETVFKKLAPSYNRYTLLRDEL